MREADAQPEPPRRRGSTIREPVRFNFDEPAAPESDGNGSPQPAPEPQRSATEEGQIAPERPRRTGWWSRR
jgi:hypothetical protein